MSDSQRNGDAEEQRLVKIYMDLTAASESAARSDFMYVDSKPDEASKETSDSNGKNGHPSVSPLLAQLLFLATFAVSGFPSQATPAAPAAPVPGTVQSPSTNAFFTAPLSLADAVNIALQKNANILRAQKDLEASQGVAVQTRAVALPTVNVAGSYGAAEQTDVDVFQVPSFVTFGTPQNWSTQIKLVQSFYQGGRLLSSLRVARLTQQQAALNYQTVVADTVLVTQLAYYDVLLAAQQITVQEASVELLTRELEDATRRFDAGTVPRFNVLRAEVELANARPKLINARNRFRVSKNLLATVLGFKVPQQTVEDIPLNLAGNLDAQPYNIELSHALALALERRTELAALRKAQAVRKEDIINAKSGYKPVLQGYVGYDAHSSLLSSDLTVEDHGWIAGAQLTWNIFDGLRTQGRVTEATANYDRAGVDLDDRERIIILDVRTAYSNFIEAREVLESQKKVLEQAEEALRLARARNEAGSGTQLDVLSAQTALTDSRTTQVQALHDYDAARARLQRAVGQNVPESVPNN